MQDLPLLKVGDRIKLFAMPELEPFSLDQKQNKLYEVIGFDETGDFYLFKDVDDIDHQIHRRRVSNLDNYMKHLAVNNIKKQFTNE